MQRKMLSLYVLAAVAALAMLSPGEVRADNVFVDCDATTPPTPPTYATISEALTALAPLPGFHTIEVTGTCEEAVTINQENIRLRAPVGQTAIITRPANFGGATVRLNAVRGIEMMRLVIRDGNPCLLLTRGSRIDLTDVTIENGELNGLFAQTESTVSFRGSFISRQNQGSGVVLSNSVGETFSSPGQPVSITVENNGGAGFSVGPRSYLAVGRDDGNGPVRISGNAGSGIGISGNSLVNINGDTIIENNEGQAISVGASVLNLGAGLSQNILRNNGFGINASDGSVVGLSGNNLIQNNGGGGIQAFNNAVLTVNTRNTPDGPVGLVVEGHTTLGMNIVQGATANFNGTHKIRNNGAGPTTQPELAGGIRLARSASMSINGATEITGNTGPGIHSHTNASVLLVGPVQIANNLGPGITADMGVQVDIGPIAPGGPLPPPTTISGNSGEGILLTGVSAARLRQPPTMTGNGGTIVCDKSSWLFGDTTGIAGIACINVDATKAKK